MRFMIYMNSEEQILPNYHGSITSPWNKTAGNQYPEHKHELLFRVLPQSE